MMDRKLFECGTDELGMQAIAFSGGESVELSLNNEWCGSTETGFGATVNFSLSREDAERFRDFLSEWLEIR